MMDDERSKVNEAIFHRVGATAIPSGMRLNSEEIAILQMICDDYLQLIPAWKHP
jgi:hypothetical protein